ncbi:MAG: phosphate ABC transporter permease subunit PstC [Nocardioidaceae bacterium]
MTASTTTGSPRSPRRPGDRIFKGLTAGAGAVIVTTLAGVAIFLTYEGLPAFTATKAQIPGGTGIVAYLWPLVFGTLLGAVLALAIAMPLAIGVALFISHYAPRRFAGPFGYLVDLLAAVPSVVYGLWGIYFLAPSLTPLYTWLESHLGLFPVFAGPASVTGRTILTVAVVLAVMILPIVTALCREVFLQTPRLHEEAALALGATRWEMIQLSVFPHARSGMVSAAMLGLGRALGETMAVAMVLSTTGVVTFNLISNNNPSTIAANIALKFPEASGIQVNLLIASGLVLFVITFAVNLAARAVVGRRREFSGAN